MRNEPLYPFGYGLSYTTFEYSDVTLSSDQMKIDGTITASVTIKNTGRYDADEVVQLYIRDVVGSISRPVKELHLNDVIEPGDFDIMIGPNSRDVKKKRLSVIAARGSEIE